MSTASCARSSQVMSNVTNGKYVNNRQFHNYGSVREDSIMAQQRWADENLARIKREKQRNKKK